MINQKQHLKSDSGRTIFMHFTNSLASFHEVRGLFWARGPSLKVILLNFTAVIVYHCLVWFMHLKLIFLLAQSVGHLIILSDILLLFPFSPFPVKNLSPFTRIRIINVKKNLQMMNLRGTTVCPWNMTDTHKAEIGTIPSKHIIQHQGSSILSKNEKENALK
eukprot:Gb_08368 [translate_table: standard]